MTDNNPQTAVESTSLVGTSIARPTTRGELAERLNNEERCEVAAYLAEMTTIMLKGWLDVVDFTVEASENKGWVIYVPTAEVSHGTQSKKESNERN